jgi:SAM-dependent methyltransferase
MAKAAGYLRDGDLRGLSAQVREFVTWKAGPHGLPKAGAEHARTGVGDVRAKPSGGQQSTEAQFWDEFDLDLGRKISWASRPELGLWAVQKMSGGRYQDIMPIVVDTMTIPRAEPLRGLVLGCGDMLAEHTMFVDSRLQFAEVDAYDVSSHSIESAQTLTSGLGLKVNYELADVNTLELSPNRYALIVVFHSFHHFEQVDHVARQINKALHPGGVFYTFDYVGPTKLQHSERQLLFARNLLRLLPRNYRREIAGTVKDSAHSVPPDQLSPDEAIHSDQILPAIATHLNVVWQYNWGGLLYPLLEGIAFNFTDSPEDQTLLRFLFDLDYALCQAGEIEPNFTITLATKR